MTRRFVGFFTLVLLSLAMGCAAPAKPVKVHAHGGRTMPEVASAPLAPALASVNVKDLGRSVSVIGPLGEPLGKILFIEGRFVPDKDKTTYWDAMIATNLFSVEKVNGKKLPSPAWIELRNLSNTEDLKSVEYSILEGYQDGGFVGVPIESGSVSDNKDQPMQVPWCFNVVFRVLKVR